MSGPVFTWPFAARQFRFPAVYRDILWTIVSQGAVAAALFLQYWLVRKFWGIEAFSGFSQVFRVRSSIEWIVLLQLPLALVRLLSAKADHRRKIELAVAGVGTGIGLVVLWCAVFLAMPGLTAGWLLGSASYVPWVLPLSSLLFGYATFLLASGLLRGFFAFRTANLINIAAIAVVPCACLLLGRQLDIHVVVARTGLAIASVTILATAAVVALTRDSWSSPAQVTGIASRSYFGATTDLLAFGAPRLLTLAMNAGFALMIPWLVARQGDFRTLAAVNAVLAVLAGTGLVTSPAGFVLLPRFSRSVANGPPGRAATDLRVLTSSTLYVGIVGSFLAAGFLDPILRILLGSSLVVGENLLIAAAVVVPMYLLVDVLRGPMDAVSRLPFNAIVYGAGLLASGLAFVLPSSVTSIDTATRCAFALVLGYVAAAGTAFWIASRKYEARLLRRSDLFAASGWAAVVAIAAAIYPRAGGSAIELEVFSCCSAVGFAVLAVVLAPDWLRILLKPEELRSS